MEVLKKGFTVILLLTMMLMLWPSSFLAANQSLTIASKEASRGTTVDLPIVLDSTGNVVALQFKLEYDEKALVLKSLQRGTDLNAAIPFFYENKKILIGSMEEKVSSGKKTVAIATFEIKNEAEAKEYPIQLMDVSLSDSEGNEIDSQFHLVQGKVTVKSSTSGSVGGGGGGVPSATPPVPPTVPSIEINRTTAKDGTIQEEAMVKSDTIEQLKEKGTNTAQVTFTDAKDQVAKMSVALPKEAVQALKENKLELEILSDGVQVYVSNKSISAFNQDLYFHVTPIKSNEEQKEVENRAKKDSIVKEIVQGQDIQLIGRPMTIETNMQNKPVTLVLPLTANLSAAILENLAVYVEHSDGTKELIRGEVAAYNNRANGGYKFSVDKFSTFSVMYLDGAAEHFTNLLKPYINGFADQTFRPDTTVTRAQMVAMLIRNLNVTYNENEQTSYKDVSSNYWAFKEIQAAKQVGIMSGYSDELFGPEDGITRAQMAAIVYRWVKQECEKNESAYPSCNQLANTSITKYEDVLTSHWAYDEIHFVRSIGFMSGYNGNLFKPEEKLTRAQAVKVLNSLFKHNFVIHDATPTFRDVPATHWAFQEIEKAVRDK